MTTPTRNDIHSYASIIHYDGQNHISQAFVHYVGENNYEKRFDRLDGIDRIGHDAWNWQICRA